MTEKIARSWDGFMWLIIGESGKDALGRHEELPISFLGWLGKRFINMKTIFVDVGANVGMYSIRLSKSFEKIIAIEPDPNNFDILRENIKLNNIKNIYPLNVAVGDIDGEAIIKCNGVGSRVVAKAKKGTEIDGLKKVKIVRLDTLLPGIFDLENFELIVIKVDVEGFEEAVIRGAENILNDYKIVWLIEHHEYRGFKNLKSHKNIIKLLKPRYHVINFNQVQWLYVPRGFYPELFYLPVACHWFYRCIENIKEGRNWYYGLPGKFWHGKSMIDFYETLKKVAQIDNTWIELL